MERPATELKSDSDVQGLRSYDCFVSSTSVDLRAHRIAVRRAVETLRQHHLMMEDFGAQNGDAATVSSTQVSAADVFLLVVGWRYGFVPDNETLSVTHLEYLEAVRLGFPRLIFLAAPATETRDDLFPMAVRDPEHLADLHAFRAAVERDRVVAYFATPEDLERAVIRALSEYLRHQSFGIPHRHISTTLTAAKVPKAVSPPGLPRPLHLIGRDDELLDLIGRLRSGQDMGVFAAIGMPGIGKTGLAAEAVARLVSERDVFPGGAVWIGCNGLTGREGLAEIWRKLFEALLVDLDVEPKNIEGYRSYLYSALADPNHPRVLISTLYIFGQ